MTIKFFLVLSFLIIRLLEKRIWSFIIIIILFSCENKTTFFLFFFWKTESPIYKWVPVNWKGRIISFSLGKAQLSGPYIYSFPTLQKTKKRGKRV